MASTMAANGTSVHGVRSNRNSNGAASGMNGDGSRAAASHASISKNFGATRASWNNNIWGDNNLAGGLHEDHGASDTAFEPKSGSGSLLPSSELDGWNGRPNLPWSTVSSTASTLSVAHAKGRTTSPIQMRSSDLSAPALSEAADTTSYFSLPRSAGIGTSAGGMSNKSFLNGGQDNVSLTTADSISLGSFAGFQNGGDVRRPVGSSALGGTSMNSSGYQLRSGFATSLDTPRGEDATGAMSAASLQQGLPETFAHTQSRNLYSHLSHNSASFTPQRSMHAAHPSFHSENQGLDGRYGNGSIDLSAGLGNLHIGDGGFAGASQSRTNYESHLSHDAQRSRLKYQSMMDEGSYHTLASYPADSAAELHLAHAGNKSLGVDHGMVSPIEYNRISTPLYHGLDPSVGQFRSSSATRFLDGQSALVDGNLRGLSPDPYSQLPPGALRSLQFSPAYDLAGYQAARLNALSGFYRVSHLSGMASPSMVPRSHRDHDQSQIVRSPLLEEFRANSKGNKRYELRDIYNHVVEFSGDQHGSRFIQQKLETANSDEKEQIFREIQPNSLQLMTDVFGNYVVQKLFEHGNQTQKKILANQMKGHVLALSTQMYGCRVVQKALEHILTDQQAMLVKELENHVMKCVRDQNGNHVIQKAIERVPSQYVQFIITNFRGQVSRLAAHPYGCRVIQRMLEHCEEVDREFILAELHATTPTLIPDQFGNYVIQHVIENGEEKDRSRMISVVISQLLVFSKHKFASNVVEKSIEFGEESQRRHIIHTLISPNERGESPLLGLMRDQYGNYVIQKVLGQLKGSEREALIDQIKPLLSQLKKFSYGKQIVAIEKLIFDPTMLPTSAIFPGAVSSTTPPNSHKSSPQPSRRSLTGLDTCGGARLVGAAPPTPPPTDTQSTAGDTVDAKTLVGSTVTVVDESAVVGTDAAVTVGLTNSHA